MSVLTDLTICDGENTDLTVSYNGGAGLYNIVVTQPDLTQQTAPNVAGPNSMFVVSQEGAYSVTVESITDACKANAGNVNLTFHPEATATLSGDATICDDGSTTNLSVALTGTGPWTFTYNDPVTGNQVVPAIAASPGIIQVSNDGLYTPVSIVDANNCTLGTVSGNARITKESLPEPEILVTDPIVCDGAFLPMTVTDKSGNPASKYTYQWYFKTDGSPSQLINGATLSSYTAGSGTGTGAYIVVAEVAGVAGCSGASSVVSQESIDIPQPTINPKNLTVEEGLGATYTATVNQGNMTYTWYTVDGTDPEVNEGDGNPKVLTKDVGNYAIRVEVQFTSNPTVCPAKEDEANLIVYGKIAIPNVFTPNGDEEGDYWNLDAVQVFSKSTVRIYNRWGNLVYESLGGYEVPWDGTYNSKESPDGVYFYVIELNDSTETVKPDQFSGTVQIIR